MLEQVSQITPYVQYIAPPLIGAFIGYLTNKIAIRMLFRPLRARYVFGVKVPLTPGIIPAKRHQLAVNIGEMVGSHLLTSTEISKALEKPSFQDQLSGLIKNRTGTVLDRDLGSLPELVPSQFRSYFDIAVKTLAYKIKEMVHGFIATQEFERLTGRAVLNGCDAILERDFDSFAGREKREELYLSLERYIHKILASKGLEQWLEDFLYSQLSNILRNRKTLQDILPDSLTEAILSIVRSKTPEILKKLADLLKDPNIQEKLVQGIKKGVDSFTSTLGPMGGMVQGFLKVETIEKAVKDYLDNHEEDIAAWLNDEDVQARVAESLNERVKHYLNTPIVDFISAKSEVKANELCKNFSNQLTAVLKEEKVAKTLSAMLRENLEMFIEGGTSELKTVLEDIIGNNGVRRVREFTAREVVLLIRSSETRELLNSVVEQMLTTLLQKPVGKISNILPAGIREALYGSIQKLASELLAAEVPGLFTSLQIQHTVMEKVDSLDLLRLERLLLSIMEEQFKYINLFGALLGFLIGSLNVLLLYFI